MSTSSTTPTAGGGGDLLAVRLAAGESLVQKMVLLSAHGSGSGGGGGQQHPSSGGSVDVVAPSLPSSHGKREAEYSMLEFLKWYLNFGVYRFHKGKYKAGILQARACPLSQNRS